MSSLIHHPARTQRQPSEQKYASLSGGLIGGIRFDWLASFLGLVFLGGLYLDGWAHSHNKVDQSFFTIWHAFFYSGYLLSALLLVTTLWVNHRRGAAWSRALPDGYSLSLLGVLVFAAGGVGDMLWHEAFGVEPDFEALFSPTHLVLVIGLALVVTGPLRAAWARPSRSLSWATGAPALLSLAGLISALTFLTMASHPLASNIAGAAHDSGTRLGQIAGTEGILITTALLMGAALIAIRRWSLPPGALLLVWGLNTFAMAVVNLHHRDTLWLMLAMIGAMVVVDLARLRMEPLSNKTRAIRMFAAFAPILIMGAYFVALRYTEGIDWSIHMWTGVVVEAGIVGWLLSYLVFPPATPPEVK